MSIAWLALQGSYVQQITNSYFEKLQNAEDHKVQEITAVTNIQRVWRGHLARGYLCLLRANATTIQRVFRGYIDRKVCMQMRLADARSVEMAYFNYMALLIQKTFRGFLSRKFKEDFYKRKAFVTQVNERANKLRQEMSETLTSQLEQTAVEKEARATREFAELTLANHYLKSTQAQPGPLAPRSGPFGPIQPKTARGGVPMDAHFQSTFSDYWRKQYPSQLENVTQMSRLAPKTGNVMSFVPDEKEQVPPSTGSGQLRISRTNSGVAAVAPPTNLRRVNTTTSSFSVTSSAIIGRGTKGTASSSRPAPAGSPRDMTQKKLLAPGHLKTAFFNRYGSSLSGMGFSTSPFVSSSAARSQPLSLPSIAN